MSDKENLLSTIKKTQELLKNADDIIRESVKEKEAEEKKRQSIKNNVTSAPRG